MLVHIVKYRIFTGTAEAFKHHAHL